MLRTGRCHWRDKDTPALKLGRPRAAGCCWQLGDDGRQRLAFDTDLPITFTLAVSPPWYVDLDAGECGPLETGLSPAVAGAAAQAPPVAPVQAQRLPPAVQRVLAELELPPPSVLSVEELTGPPIACLRLLPGGSEKTPPSLHSWYRSAAPTPPRARLSFDYAGVEVPFDPSVSSAPAITRLDERLVRVRRDALSEEHFMDELRGCGLVTMVAVSPMVTLGGGAPFELVADPRSVDTSEAEVWRHFLRHEVPRLRTGGWRIQVDEQFNHRIAIPQAWYGDARESEEGGWFDLDLGVIIDGRRRPLLPLLHQWFKRRGTLEALERLADDDEVVVKEPDGCSLFLPVARVRTILKTLLELYDPDLRLAGDELRLSAWRAAEVERLVGQDDPAAPWRWRGGERLRAMAQRLESFHGIEPLSPPPGFGAALRTTSMPTPRPEIAVTSAAVEKPGSKISFQISLSLSLSGSPRSTPSSIQAVSFPRIDVGDEGRQSIGQQAKLLFALAQRLFLPLALGDVQNQRVEPFDLSVRPNIRYVRYGDRSLATVLGGQGVFKTCRLATQGSLGVLPGNLVRLLPDSLLQSLSD